jgi:hypothetical protein
MRMFIFGAVASVTVFGAVLLAALAQDFKEHPRAQCTATFSIDPRELTGKAAELPTQQIDDLI